MIRTLQGNGGDEGLRGHVELSEIRMKAAFSLILHKGVFCLLVDLV